MKTIVTKLVHCPLRGWCSTEARSERTLSKRRRSKITCKHCTLPGQRKLPNSLLRGVCLCLWIIERCPPTFLIVAPIPAMFRLSRRNKKNSLLRFSFPFFNERIARYFSATRRNSIFHSPSDGGRAFTTSAFSASERIH